MCHVCVELIIEFCLSFCFVRVGLVLAMLDVRTLHYLLPVFFFFEEGRRCGSVAVNRI